MRKFSFSLFLLCSISSIAYSQSDNIDSLRRVVASGKRDTSVCLALDHIGIYYYLNVVNFDSAMFYGQQAAAIAENGALAVS